MRLSGVPVGKVKSVRNDGGGVTVALDIDGKAKIPKGSSVTVASAGVMGEKFINILPGKDQGFTSAMATISLARKKRAWIR